MRESIKIPKQEYNSVWGAFCAQQVVVDSLENPETALTDRYELGRVRLSEFEGPSNKSGWYYEKHIQYQIFRVEQELDGDHKQENQPLGW